VAVFQDRLRIGIATDTLVVDDIADYLGLTIETVSRTISHMEHAATIALPKSRRIELKDPGALRRLNA